MQAGGGLLPHGVEAEHGFCSCSGVVSPGLPSVTSLVASVFDGLLSEVSPALPALPPVLQLPLGHTRRVRPSPPRLLPLPGTLLSRPVSTSCPLGTATPTPIPASFSPEDSFLSSGSLF